MDTSTSRSKTSASDSDLIIGALDHIQGALEDAVDSLTHLEARPILDLTGIERRQEELHDELIHLARYLRPAQRGWWLTPTLVSVAFVLGVLLGWEMVTLQVNWGTPPVPAVIAPAPAQGKKK